MKILLSGSQGFIGSRFQTMFGDDNEIFLAHFDQGIGCDIATVTDGEKNAIKDVENLNIDVFVNLAWINLGDYSWKTLQRNYILHTNIGEYINRIGVKRVINFGSCWEYDSMSGSCIESDTLRTQSRFSACKSSIRSYFDALENIDHYWLRIFFIFGFGQRRSALIPSIMNAIEFDSNLVLHAPGNVLDFVYVDDVARAIMEFCETNEHTPEIYNIGTGRGRSCLEIFEKLQSQVDRLISADFPNGQEFCNQKFWANTEKIESMTWFKNVTQIDDALRLTRSFYL